MRGDAYLVCIVAGLFALIPAWKDWDWFMYMRPTRTLMTIFGRKATRIFYIAFGCYFLLLGLGIIQPPL